MAECPHCMDLKEAVEIVAVELAAKFVRYTARELFECAMEIAEANHETNQEAAESALFGIA